MADKKVIADATVTITSIALISKVFGFIGSFILAAKFGATGKTDAYFVASNIPELLRDVLAGGALTCAFIPVYTTCLAKDMKVEAQRLAAGVFNIVAIGLVLMTGFGILLAPQLTHLVAPGFSGETLALSIKLTRVLFPAIIFFGLASLFGAMLNSYQHFTIPALQPLILNTCQILAMLMLARHLDIYSICIGTLVGGVIITAMNLPFIYRKGIRYMPQFNFHDEGIRRMGLLWLPLILGLSVNQVNIIVNKILASSLSSGSISGLNYANLINQIAPSVFGVAVSTAIFPSLSWHMALDQQQRFREIVSKAIRVTLIITVPLSIFLMFLSTPIIKLLFERGAFDHNASVLTSGVLFYFGIGTFALAVNYVLIRAFYALSDTRTPVKLAVTAVIANIILSIILVKFMEQDGLALASSIAAVTQLGLLLAFLQKKIGQLKLKMLLADFIKTISASLVSVGLGVWVIGKLALWLGNEGFFLQLLNLGLTAGAVTILYMAIISVLKVEEMENLVKALKKK